MSEADVELVKAWIADWTEHHDLDRTTEEYYADEIEFEVAFQGGRDLADATVLHGRDEVREYFTDFLQPFGNVRYELDDVIDLGGGDVLLLARVFLEIAESTAEVSPPAFAYLLTIRGGRIARVQDFPDRDEALRHVGLGQR
jgi:ketosteroid isomerase-like protein